MASSPEPRPVRQDFGHSATAHAGGRPGEAGGYITPAAEPAYYAARIAPADLERPLRASGKLLVEEGAGHVMLGFFNSRSVNEWRTPNSLGFRLNGRGRGFYAYAEYATARWRAGGDAFATPDPLSGRRAQELFPNRPLEWELVYDPTGAAGRGSLLAHLGGRSLTIPLEEGHRTDGAAFNRFGLLAVSKSADDGGRIWIDDVSVQSRGESFSRDPRWDGRGNRARFTSDNVRPRFRFGYSPTRYAGGRRGEIGGLIFRGDERYAERMAYYGADTGDLDLSQPLEASGRVCLRRGVTDSTVLFGYFHSTGSNRLSNAQRSALPENFLGFAIEGPSREGFLFYPACGVDADSTSLSGVNGPAPGVMPPRIFPNGRPHAWSFRFRPAAGGGGTVHVALDGEETWLNLPPELTKQGARFNRFGFVTTHIDGNGQEVYVDDVQFTTAGTAPGR